MRAQAVDLDLQVVFIGQVADADGAAADLVLIGRADAATGGADLAGARRVLTQAVEVAVERQDQRAGLGDLQVCRGDLDALPLELGDLVTEMPGIQHHAIADHRQRATHDARRQQRELVDLFADDQRVAGIMSALETGDDIGALRQPVDDLALAFVTPLGADHGNICHGYTPPPAARTGHALRRDSACRWNRLGRVRPVRGAR